MAVENSPAVIARLLRHLAMGTDHQASKTDVIFVAAAEILEKPKDEKAIIAKAYISAAEVFETYASDQIASKRMHRQKGRKHECDVRAEIWNDAAKELRKAATS